MVNKEIKDLKIFLWSRRNNLNYGARKYINPYLIFKVKNFRKNFLEEKFFTKSNNF